VSPDGERGAWAVLRRVGLGTRKSGNWTQLLKFSIVGGSGYLVNLLVFVLLLNGLDFNHLVAATGAFCVAVTNNFIWNRVWTFSGGPSRVHRQATRFFAVSVFALGVNLLVLALLVDSFGVAELPAQAVAVAVAMPVNFVGNKLWTFEQ